MSVFVEASHPSIPGASVREGLLLRGALIERERIVALLRGDDRFVGARRLLIELIEGAPE